MKTILLILLFSLFCLASQSKKIFSDPNGITHLLDSNTYIQNWIIAGPFPNQLKKMPDGNDHYGFFTDFLLSLGGEKNAILEKSASITFKDQNNIKHKLIPQFQKAEKNSVINFEKIYGRMDYKAAYAYCEIYSDKQQKAHFLFGSDDGAKVWINGELVHSIYAGRGLKFAEDAFNTSLKTGKNKVLVKITQWVRGWAFAMQVLNEEGFNKYQKEVTQKEDFIKFLDVPLVIKGANPWNVYFTPGQFPQIEWQQPYLVEKAVGKFPLSIRWFDKELNEVKMANTPGRYAFFAEGTTPNGIKIRRSKTVYCMPDDWIAWGERLKAYLNYLPLENVDEKAWNERKNAIADYTGRIILLSILNQQDGAILMSYLDEMEAMGKPAEKTDTPMIKDHEFHLGLKRKILRVENKWPALKMPVRSNEINSPVLREASDTDGDMIEGTSDSLINICKKWYEESKEPFNIVIAKNGVIIVDEAFGERPDGQITTETTSEIASITKLLTGLLFAQFVEQGLIDIDDPVGKFLPDIPSTGEKVLTLRHCFTHTSGLWSHTEWRGVHNPWLDNVVANVLPYIEVAKTYEYNGMGYNLAGKVMEIVSGKSIIRLFREHFFDPLELNNTVLEEDLAFSCHTNARELAVIAQLLLNRGSYGDLKFFSPEVLDKFMPKQLNQYYPDVYAEQGIGINWAYQSHPDAGKNGMSQDETILSKNVVGHGSATSSIFQVDFDNNIVITQTRRREGKHYHQYLEKLLLALRKG